MLTIYFHNKFHILLAPPILPHRIWLHESTCSESQGGLCASRKLRAMAAAVYLPAGHHAAEASVEKSDEAHS